MEAYHPDIVAVTIPFPGNLYSALRCGEWIKKHYPGVTVAMGGGFANTELRSLTDARFFAYTDYLLLDDGELPISRLIEHVRGGLDESGLVRTFMLQDGSVVYHDDVAAAIIPQRVFGVVARSVYFRDRDN